LLVENSQPIERARQTVNHLTPRACKGCFDPHGHVRVNAMENEIDLLTASTALGVASYVAIILASVARDDLGFSSGQIRYGAILGAVAIALAIRLDLLGKRPRKTG
jgi:hypothetical protein